MAEQNPDVPKNKRDPEEFRMTIGEHLEELRKRLFLGIFGFFITFCVFMYYGTDVLTALCRPLTIAQEVNNLPASLITLDPSEGFMTYIKAAMISAAAVAAPWMLYQLWLFVAAGLFPHERKYVTKYLPLSLALLIVGMLFLYFYVLPLMLEFFLSFKIGDTPPLPHALPITPGTTQPVQIPVLSGDPAHASPGAMWINSINGLLKICVAAPDKYRVIPFGSESLTTPMISLSTYFDMVIGMLLSFGIAFQLPLAVLALVRIGIMELQTFKKMRRVVYFILAILAAVIVPDVVTGMIALLLPLIFLYEFGILLATWATRKSKDPD